MGGIIPNSNQFQNCKDDIIFAELQFSGYKGGTELTTQYMSDLTSLEDCDSDKIKDESIEFDECLLENAMYEIKTSSTYLGTNSAHRFKISGRFNDFDLAKGNNELNIKAIYSSRDSGFY